MTRFWRLGALSNSVPLSMVACGVMLALLWRGWALASDASGRRGEAAESCVQVATTAAAYARLAELAPVAQGSDDAHARLDASTLVTAVLQRAGLNSSVLRDTVADAESSTPSGYVRRGFRITLDGLEPHELGRFLAAWREREPLWTISRLDLTRTASPMDRSRGYRVSCSMTSFVDTRPRGGIDVGSAASPPVPATGGRASAELR